MKRQRRQYSADWKAKVALEAIKGQRTVQEIASHYEVHPTLVTHWKRKLLEGVAEIFSNGKRAADADEESGAGVMAIILAVRRVRLKLLSGCESPRVP